MSWFFYVLKRCSNRTPYNRQCGKLGKKVATVNKFMDVDLIDSLTAIMRQNTGFYQSDFEMDKRILEKAISEPETMDRTFLWLSRPCGTYCFKESDVFLKDTPSYNAWQFYGERNHDRMLAYVVEITHHEGEKIMGNLYELDFRRHCKHVADKALTADYVKLVYENGSMKQPVKQSISGEDDLQLGRLMYFEYQPDDSDAWRHILREEKQNRKGLKQGNFKEHIASLQTSRIEIEARQIVNKIGILGKPNSSDGEYFMTAVSPVFTALASSEDLKQLYLMMPYKKYTFSEVRGRCGIYVLVAKEYRRNKNIRKIHSIAQARSEGQMEKIGQRKKCG